MKNKAKNSVMLIGLGLLALTGNVSADNSKSYNGIGCDNSDPKTITALERNAVGIKNTSNAAVEIACPIVIDSVYDARGVDNVWISWTGPGVMECILTNINSFGETLRFNKSGWKSQGWINVPAITVEDYAGSMSLHCALPAGGTLHTYYVNEKGDN